MSFDRDRVMGELTSQMVIDHYGADGRWFGRWFRSKWCPITTHSTAAFGLSRDGRWHCHACGDDAGGDLLHLIAAAEGLHVRRDFGAVLEVAAGIAGVPDEDAFGGDAPAPRPRPQRADPALERAKRLTAARLACKYLWLRLDPRMVATPRQSDAGDGPAYLRQRGLDPLALWRLGERLRFTPAHILPAELWQNEELRKTSRMFSAPAVCLPVRSASDGEMIDIRARRISPREGEPKILGMPGGVTSPDGEFAGCYGRPHELGIGDVIITEGWADYLAARLAWPDEDVLGAVDAGQLRGLGGFAGAHCADVGSRLIILAHDDGDDGAAATGADKASTAALRAGVSSDSLFVVDCRVSFGGKDLAELAPHRGGLDEARDALLTVLGRE